MTEFTPFASLLGGMMIGLSAVLLMLWEAGLSHMESGSKNVCAMDGQTVSWEHVRARERGAQGQSVLRQVPRSGLQKPYAIPLLWEGRIAGISGIAGRLLPPYRDGAFLSRFGFVVGLIAAPLVTAVATGEAVGQTVSSNVPLMIVAGLLVGFGSVWGNGCTSGHGVCGLSRLSTRSFVATGVFMTTAFVTVFLVRHVIGG